MLENVVVDERGVLDLDDDSKTENTRAAYKLEQIANALPAKRAGHPSSVVFLTADAFGILPPIARLSRDQAMYWFLSGFTAKLAGTEIGVTEPQPTFSACFGAPFLPQPPSVYAHMLGGKLDAHPDVRVWLVNTGWTGGPFGEGRRMPIAATRTLLDAALSGELADAEYRVDPTFGLEVPVAVPGVDQRLLDPRATWADPSAYDAKAAELARMFRENFTRFDDVSPGVAAPGRVTDARGSNAFLPTVHTRAAIRAGCRPRSPRRFAVLLAGALLAAALVAAAGRSGDQAAPREHAYALTADAIAPLRPSRLAQADVTFRGGPITTSTGETVDVQVSTALPADTSTPESWAEFLTGLTHGPEISLLTVYIVTFDEAQQICGLERTRVLRPRRAGRARRAGAGGRDSRGGRATRVRAPRRASPAEHPVGSDRPGAQAVGERDGRLCTRRAPRGLPGDEGPNYSLNPGEAWAETYRLMTEREAGITTATWPIISQSFYPTAAALQAAKQDVVSPWVKPRTLAFTRVFGRKTAKVWWIRLATPLDGDLRVSATVPNGATSEVALVGADRRAVVRRAQWVSQRVERLTGSVCGQRSFFVRVSQKGALGRVRVSVTAP